MNVKHPKRTSAPLPAGEALLELSNVRVSYGGIQALRGISMRVDPGEIVALVGANGAGKSTTLRAIMGLAPLAGGTVRFAGASVDRMPTETRVEEGLALAPEGRGIFPNLTVRENLELGAYHHRDRLAMDETTSDVVRLFPRLGERFTQDGGTLSGGEQQMLAIGRALMSRPRLLLLDEPSLGIAPKLVQQIFEAIRTIAASGVTVLLVEQNTRLALATSHRAYVLRVGEVVLHGPSREVSENPDVQAAYLG